MSRVTDILEQMAANAGQAARYRGALIGNAVDAVGNIPADVAAARDKQRLEAQRTGQVQQQMQLAAAQGARETVTAGQQTQAFNEGQNKQAEAKRRETVNRQAWQAAVEGSGGNPAKIDIQKGMNVALTSEFPDVAAEMHAHYDAMQKPALPLITNAPGSTTSDPNKPLDPTTGRFPVVSEGGPPPITNEWESYMRDTAPGLASKASWAQMTPVERGQALKDFTALKADPAATRAAAATAAATDRAAALTAAASDRQTATIAASTAQQGRAQEFETKKTARADIQKNADTPYQASLSAADELRGMVAAAQSGNKIAASEQALTTAAATIRGFGLNRINMAEIGMPAGAGNAVDRVTNFIGKWKSGEPVNPDLQKDMLGVADVLEKAARKKYNATHNGINALYGTTIPQTFPEAAPTSTGPAPGLAGQTYQDYVNSKKK